MSDTAAYEIRARQLKAGFAGELIRPRLRATTRRGPSTTPCSTAGRC